MEFLAGYLSNITEPSQVVPVYCNTNNCFYIVNDYFPNNTAILKDKQQNNLKVIVDQSIIYVPEMKADFKITLYEINPNCLGVNRVVAM